LQGSCGPGNKLMDTRATPGTSMNISAQGERTFGREVLARELAKRAVSLYARAELLYGPLV
ncbi:MAG TPA: hypothetical protein DDY54_06755, partial [Deltaproteobacteria bacterium]|nr:hypothetical protein [Deltaproteobacteria bacterium]